jgi:hypothetical protein
MSRPETSAPDAPVAAEEQRAELAGLVPGLRWLDARLAEAVRAAHVRYGPQAAADPFRGLHIGPGDVDRMLARAPGAPLLPATTTDEDTSPPRGEPSDTLAEEGSQLRWLAEAYGLSAFDLGIVLIALAPELDLRYERLYAYLQDDVTRRRPSVDLALHLLCGSADARLVRRWHFSPDAPLLRGGLIQLLGEPPLLGQGLALDGQIVRFLLGEESLDPALALFTRLIEPTLTLDGLTVPSGTRAGLARLAARSRDGAGPLRLFLQSPDAPTRAHVAEALASDLGMRLLVVETGRMATAGADLGRLVARVLREAWFRLALPVLDGVDGMPADAMRALLSAMADDHGGVLLGGSGRWPPADVSTPPALGVLAISLGVPDAVERQRAWMAALASEGIDLSTEEQPILADRFRLTASQIAEATATASALADWRRSAGMGPEPVRPPEGVALEDLFAAARAQSAPDLSPLATRIEPRRSWQDLVLPDDTLVMLREIGGRVAHRYRVLTDWGFDAQLSLGKGTTVLFAGPSGTGKTLAAEVLARELGLDLYRIDLAGVVSKYIGETEKNLDRIFTAAETANAVLFFDEADALFGKRSEVRDSHDRYANLEIAYLLQKMEQYEGMAILATNLRANLDDAFLRRLAFVVHFPFPDETLRRRIWAGIWPATTPLGPDVDLDRLAREFKLTGGHIRNVALAAAFLAAQMAEPVAMAHVLHAIRRELQKLGGSRSEPAATPDRP